jgi:hypothetical protein
MNKLTKIPSTKSEELTSPAIKPKKLSVDMDINILKKRIRIFLSFSVKFLI